MINLDKMSTDWGYTKTYPTTYKKVKSTTSGTTSGTTSSGSTSTASNPYSTWTPEEWAQSADYYRGLMNSNYTVPSQWTTGSKLAEQMATTGNLVDTSGWYGANKGKYQTAMQDAANQLLEEAGLGGTRWSSATNASLTDQARRMAEDMAASEYSNWATAQENAANRKLEGLSQLYTYGSGESGLSENALNRGLSAAQNLEGVGTSYYNAPLTLASTLSNLGSNLNSNQLSWAQLLSSAVGNPSYTQTTYQPSTSSNILAALSSIISSL